MKVSLPPVPFDLPPKPRELTAAAPSYAIEVSGLDPDLPEGDGDAPVIDVIESAGVRWGPRRDWGKV